jgi:deoxyribose-phosphate aldolase
MVENDSRMNREEPGTPQALSGGHARAGRRANSPSGDLCVSDGVRGVGVLGAGVGLRRPHMALDTPSSIASIIDHTLLRPEAAWEEIERLCGEAVYFKFATICINPCWVRRSAELLTGTGVGVCSVVGFPLGATTMEGKASEACRAIRDGAREIDMVINVGALKSGEVFLVEDEIARVASLCRGRGALTKVIVEAALLTDEEKVTACRLARNAGADFVKTSTGFGPGGATVADVSLMRRTVGQALGVKAAGGIRDLRTLRAMVAAGATRIGASAGVSIVREAVDGQSG